MKKTSVESSRGLKYCREYAELMNGPHDDNRERGYNDVPVDALTLSDLRKKKIEEILGIVNQMGKVQNKSDIRVMYAHGYGFSWGDLLVVAAFLGFEKDSGTDRAVHFYCPGITEEVPEKRDDSLNTEAYEAIKAGRDKDIDRTISVFDRDRDKIIDYVKKNAGKGNWMMAQALVVEKMVEMYLPD
ncbi:MAG: hypothetical protein PUJ54_04800 [Lachnospiraceae bacterium]|nr:hypothetical protein [Lachnospiraceae bacterium]MDY4118357.1 hypothetical protein [Lachnospiraceae bacterium]